MFRGITDSSSDIWWPLSVPLKNKVFIWLVSHNKILTKDSLHKRGWIGTFLLDEANFLFCLL
jgi:zinc-binding in reverse transcriptase